MPKTTVVPISLPTVLAKELDRVAAEEAMTRSEFMRDLLRRRLALAVLNDFRKEFSRRAKKAGIRTLADAVRVVREVRRDRAAA